MQRANIIGAIFAGLMLGAAPIALAAPPADEQSAANQASPLGTPEQIAADRALITLLADPEVKAIQARLLTELGATPAAAAPDGKTRLANAIQQWTGSLVQRVLAADPAHPLILWQVDNTPHRWHGLEVPGRAVAGDNPDHIYRGTFLDGSGRYEIIGKVVPGKRPAQFSFEATRGGPSKLVLKAQSPGKADMGNQIAMLTDRDIQVAPDGSFRVTIGGEGTGPNHLRSEPGPLAVNIRDVLSDWSQRPNRLAIRRLDKTDAKPRDPAAVRAQILADLPDYVRFWAGFKDRWFGGLKPNTIVGPVARDGNWGFLAAARYRLAPDEVIVVRTTRGAARYTGVQVTDPWMVAPDGAKHVTSINTAQAVADQDGGFTYVISPRDPGVANWVDTGGLHEGYILLRWQGFEPGADANGLLTDFRVEKRSDLAGLTAVAKSNPGARGEQLAQRAQAYRQRLSN
jgi:hypothetical protein